MAEVPNRTRVVVRGKNILRPPLIDSTEPEMVEIYDSDNRISAFFTRLPPGNLWGMSTRADPDWPEMCIRYGFSTLKSNVALTDVVHHGVRNYIDGGTL